MKKESIDYVNDEFWNQFEQEFYTSAKESFNELKDELETKTEELYVFVNGITEFPIFFIDPDEENVESEDGIVQFEVDILGSAYEKYEEEKMTISYEYLQKRLFKHVKNSMNKLKSSECFDNLYENQLSIFFMTLDIDPELVCEIER